MPRLRLVWTGVLVATDASPASGRPPLLTPSLSQGIMHRGCASTINIAAGTASPHLRAESSRKSISVCSSLIARAEQPRRALVCFERQVEAQCNAVAPRPCSVYVASDSAAASGPSCP